MERQNADLFWENCRIMLENELLKKKAEQLKQENQLLAAEMKMWQAAENPNSNSNSNSNPQDGNQAGSSFSANQNNSKKQGKDKKM